MAISWIVVANSTDVKIYETQRARLLNGTEIGDGLKLVYATSHPESRLKNQDLISDKPGAFTSSPLRSGQSAPSVIADHKKQEFEAFAREISENLEIGRKGNVYHDLIVVAPAAFQGYLNQVCNPQIQSMISVTIEKDYTKFKPRELVSQLLSYL